VRNTIIPGRSTSAKHDDPKTRPWLVEVISPFGDAKNLLFPSEESKEDKWPIIFPVLRFVLIRPSLNLREPLERSFNV
jgi:hypothetical protein